MNFPFSQPTESVSAGHWRRYRLCRDRLAHGSFFILAGIPISLLVVMLAALLYRSAPILRAESVWGLLSGKIWLPSQGKFGFLPYILGTMWVTGAAVFIAVPPCLFTAIYLAEYAHPRLRILMKPLLDLMAAIPSVVYGVWGMIAIVPLVQSIAPPTGKIPGFLSFFTSDNPTGFSVLAGGIVLAVMIAPFIIAVTYEVMRTVPDGYREASLALGATRWEMVKHVVLIKTQPGIIAGIVLGASRALGETMAVLMVVGNVPKIPTSIFDPAYPLPALIANNYGEMLSIPLYDAALMAAALILLLVVLVFNVLSALVLRRIKQETAR